MDHIIRIFDTWSVGFGRLIYMVHGKQIFPRSLALRSGKNENEIIFKKVEKCAN
jgi:hypothetical protein